MIRRRSFIVFFANTAGHHRGGADAETERHGVDDGQHRFRDADGCDRVGADARHEEHVDDGEQRLHRHLEHHRHRKHDQRRPDRTNRVVALRAAHRFEKKSPVPPH